MGVSTDGMLLYGYIWDDEIDLMEDNENEDGDEWVDIVAKRRGIPDPWDSYVEPDLPYEQRRAFSTQWVKDHDTELDALYAAKRAIEAEFAVTISWHGSDQWRVPYVHIKEAEITAWRGSPRSLTGMHLDRNPEWDEKLDRFLDELGIEKPEDKDGEPQEPGWWIASWWG